MLGEAHTRWTTSTTSEFLYLAHITLTDSRRFGNYIGEAEESEEEDAAPTHINQYLDDDDEEEAEVVNDQQLMEVDGMESSDEILEAC